jgi:hypothetical protein
MTVADCLAHLASVGLDPDWVSFPPGAKQASIHNLEFKGPTRLLHRYLIEADWVEELS